MAMPNRHIAMGGMLGCLLKVLIVGPWGWAVGLVSAFLSHPPIDWTFNECWQRTPKDNFRCMLILGPAILVMLGMMWWVFGFWVMFLMSFASLLMDVIDDLIIGSINKIREKKGLAPIPCWFPCHWGSPEYITIFGKKIRWYREPFHPEESLKTTIEREFLSSVVVAVGLLAWKLFK